MRRKLIQQKDSYTLTVPKRWILHNNLSGDDEVDIQESENTLVITGQNTKIQKRCTINFTHTNLAILHSKIISYYCRGYEIFEITAKHDFSYVDLHKMVEKITGAIILEFRSNFVLIECGMQTQVNIPAMIDKLFISVGYMYSLQEQGGTAVQMSAIYSSVSMLKNYLIRLIQARKFGDEKMRDIEFIVYYLSRLANVLAKLVQKYETISLVESQNHFERIQKSYLKKDLNASITITDEIAILRRDVIFDDAPQTLQLEYLYLLSFSVRSVLL